MQEVPIQIDFIAFVICIGIFLGIFISYFIITKSWRQNTPNLYMGFFILSISLAMLEGWLNYTGYIFKMLWLTNFAEPFNFIIAPLIYLFVSSQIGNAKSKNWIHFMPFTLWAGYCIFFFLQPDTFKYNSNIL